MIYVITGPTGSGKSALALTFAKRIGGEIINADAFQVYRGLDIGTAKVAESEQKSIKHHLIDIRDPSDQYDVATYQKDARKVISALLEKGTPVIMCGGTGLYIKATLFDYVFEEEAHQDNSVWNDVTDAELHRRLKEVDPISAEAIGVHNRRRILRALAIHAATGTTKSAHLERHAPLPVFAASFIGIDIPRAQLYAHVDDRVTKMISSGLVMEARALYDAHGSGSRALQAIGYKQLIPHFEGHISLDEAIAAIKQATRNYIKRQYTYFHHQLPMQWFPAADAALDFLMKEQAHHG